MTAPTGIPGIAAATPVAAAMPLAALGDPGQESLRRLAALETGKAFQAQVLSRLSNGDFVVGIADTAARMALPEGTRVGEQLSLTLIGREPRPLFMLERPAAQDHASFSNAARTVSSLIRDGAAAPSALPGAAPLSPSGASLAVAPLEAALRQSLEYSGLFYESHVSQWAHGARSLQQLMREPQMQAGKINPPGDSPELLVYQAGTGTEATAAQAAGGMELDAGRLIRQQLDTLEQRSVAWHGELHPGQPMQWEVREESRDASGRTLPPSERAWQSMLRLELPALGPVAATVQLQGGHLQLRLRTGDAGSAALLRAAGGTLAAALEAAGLPLDLMTVSHEAA